VAAFTVITINNLHVVSTGFEFDFHTPPPNLIAIQQFDVPAREQKGTPRCWIMFP